MVQTDEHRGRLITLHGTLWQLELLDPGDPEIDDELYEAWMFTPDSGENPYRLLLTEIPAGLTPGEQIDEQVLFTGYFIKRYGYVTEGGQHVAPMLIGKTLRIIQAAPAPTADETSDQLSRYVIGFFVVMSCVFGLVIWRLTLSDRKFEQSRVQKIADSRLNASPDDLAALGNIETVDPNKVFEEPAEE